ncbi:AAA family ATPase [Deinococcus deserti]|uniref:Putative shikimate kinase n=1 Tax=Deinococcus deserti (strain DSM 17065 / CIP 109153 / LMG 22923 / VCD115) TaxID=546414 RepID=C1CWT2_DEIDV|nr:AAA family ATPase [Deinococcus deserti]ACO46649.1 putative shikimate kinase [Deinococcus deserti VCD115]
MASVLITGMSGSGKSTLIGAFAARGLRAIDTDSDEWSMWSHDETGRPDWVWREDQMHALLDQQRTGSLFVCGCKTNQGRFYRRFDQVVLLSAPLPVLLQRIAQRTGNPYGKSPEERALILEHVAVVEPLLRASADVELNSSLYSVDELTDLLVALGSQEQVPRRL